MGILPHRDADGSWAVVQKLAFAPVLREKKKEGREREQEREKER